MVSRSAISSSICVLVLSLGCDNPLNNSRQLPDSGTDLGSNPAPNHLVTEVSDVPPGKVDMTPPTAEDADAAQQLKLISRGMNVGNYLDQPSNPPKPTQSQCAPGAPPQEGASVGGGKLAGWMFEAIREAGFDNVRITINWNCHTHATDSNPYEIDKEWFDRIDVLIAHVITRNMAAIIDIHNFWDYFNGLPDQRAKFISLWTQIANHYQNYPKQLFFDILNEPPYGFSDATWGTDLAAAIQAIRASNPWRTLIYGGTDYNKAYTLTRITQYLPTNDTNLIATVHYYSPYCFTTPPQSWDCASYYGTAYASGMTDVQWPVPEPEAETGDAGDAVAQASENKVKADFDSAASIGQQIGRPIYLGEFGASSGPTLTMASRVAYISAVARAAEARNMGWANWGFVNTTFDAWNGTLGWYPQIVEALTGYIATD
jgi:endoglucanase